MRRENNEFKGEEEEGELSHNLHEVYEEGTHKKPVIELVYLLNLYFLVCLRIREKKGEMEKWT